MNLLEIAANLLVLLVAIVGISAAIIMLGNDSSY